MEDEVGVILHELYPGATLTGRVVNYSAFERSQDHSGGIVPVYYEVRLQNGILKMVKVYKTHIVDAEKEFNLVQSFGTQLARDQQDDLILKYEYIYHKQEEGLHFVGTEHFETTLDEYVRQKQRLEENEAVPILSNLLAVVDALKAGPYLHRCISPTSVVLVKDPHSKGMLPKLTDFGWITEGTSTECIHNDPRFTSPKMIAIRQQMTRSALGPDNQPIEYGESVDVWSTLAVFYFMLFGKPPFANLDLRTDLRTLSKISGKNLLFDSRVKVSENCKDLLTEFLVVRDTPRQSDMVEDFGVDSVFDQKLFDSVRDSLQKELMVSDINRRTSIRIPGAVSKREFKPNSSTEEVEEKTKSFYINQVRKIDFLNETISGLEALLERANLPKEEMLKPEIAQLLEKLAIFVNILSIVQKMTIDDLSQDLELPTGKSALREIFRLSTQFSSAELDVIFETKWHAFKDRLREEGKRIVNLTKNNKQSSWIGKKYEQLIVDGVVTSETRHLPSASHSDLVTKAKWYAGTALKDLSDSNKNIRRVFKESCNSERHFLVEALYHAAVGLRFVGLQAGEEREFGEQLRARIYNSINWKDKLDELKKSKEQKKDKGERTQSIKRAIEKLKDPRNTSRCGSGAVVVWLIVVFVLLAALWWAIKRGLVPPLQRRFESISRA